MDIDSLKADLLNDAKEYIASMKQNTPATRRPLADIAAVLDMFDHYKNEFWPEHIMEHTAETSSYLSQHEHNPY